MRVERSGANPAFPLLDDELGGEDVPRDRLHALAGHRRVERGRRGGGVECEGQDGDGLVPGWGWEGGSVCVCEACVVEWRAGVCGMRRGEWPARLPVRIRTPTAPLHPAVPRLSIFQPLYSLPLPRPLPPTYPRLRHTTPTTPASHTHTLPFSRRNSSAKVRG